MSIRIKLIIVYMIMIIISAFILFTSSFSMLTGFFGKVADVILGDDNLDQVAYEVVDLLADLNSTEKIEPDRLLEPSYQKTIQERISSYSSSLVVEYRGDFTNVGDIQFDDSFYQELEKKETRIRSPRDKMIHYRKGMYFIIEYTLNYNQQDVFYHFVVDVTPMKKTHSMVMFKLLMMLLGILLIVILPLTFILSKDIIQPLKMLEKGTQNIKEGNLDFTLEAKTKNEIGRVIDSFDKMRYELKQSIEAEIQYEENRKELISSISHDLKTPITSIKGYVEGIMDGVANSPEKLNKYLQVIYNKSEHMDRLIDDLFLFSKLDMNRLPFDMEPVHITRFIDDCMEELRLEPSMSRIELQFDNRIDSNTVVSMDSQKIRRVIFNIVQNAIKYMHKPKKVIALTTREGDQEVRVQIRDNGMGIKQDQLAFIFNKFYRVDQSRNTGAGGTGLGLSIAKQIIEAHGGRIWAKSKQGEGTTLYFTLKKVISEEIE